MSKVVSQSSKEPLFYLLPHRAPTHMKTNMVLANKVLQLFCSVNYYINGSFDHLWFLELCGRIC
jgi:hypothetical protein